MVWRWWPLGPLTVCDLTMQHKWTLLLNSRWASSMALRGFERVHPACEVMGGVPRWSAAFELTGRTKCQTIKGYLPESSRKNKVPNNQGESEPLHHVPIKGKMSYKVISFWINFLLLYWIFILRSRRCPNDWYVFGKLEDMDLDLSRLLKRRDFKP